MFYVMYLTGQYRAVPFSTNTRYHTVGYQIPCGRSRRCTNKCKACRVVASPSRLVWGSFGLQRTTCLPWIYFMSAILGYQQLKLTIEYRPLPKTPLARPTLPDLPYPLRLRLHRQSEQPRVQHRCRVRVGRASQECRSHPRLHDLP